MASLDDENKENKNDNISNKPIILNVGGIRYSTSMQTLCMCRNTMLSKMFDSNFPLKLEDDGSYFIDRDGTHFRYILNFLRDNNLNVPSNESLINELLSEVKYYQIKPMFDAFIIKQIDSNILKPEHILQIQQYLKKMDGNQTNWDLRMKYDFGRRKFDPSDSTSFDSM